MGKKTATTETAEPVKTEIPPVRVELVSLEDKILKQTSGDIADLLQSNWPAIYQSYRRAHVESGEEEFTFGIGLGVKLQPDLHAVKVTVKLSYAVKYTDETEPAIVSNQPDMFRA